MRKKNTWKKYLSMLLVAAMLALSLTACDDDEEYEDEYEEEYDDEDEEEEDDEKEASGNKVSFGEHGDPDQTWAVYWYLCGSDLESDGGAASMDLEEMMEVNLPKNVKVVIETGGAYSWENDFVDPNYQERYVYSNEGMECVDQQPAANMGDPETLADFLTFCTENYPADRTAVLFWNHGGGSVSGAAFDENFDYDSLVLGEMTQAFDSVFGTDYDNPPVDLIGFDTCLMATVDTAHAFSGIGKYLVASEEFEPGSGWLYSDWLQRLADDPSMDGALLGKEICDSYIEDSSWYDEATLSLTDLQKAGPLFDAYEEMGVEALAYALDDPTFFGDFGRAAMNSENYGGNTRDQGYANMVDLGHLAENCSDILPQKSQNVLNCLDDCVLYKVNGAHRENARGLSCYFSYNGDLSDLHGFQQEGCSDSFKYFFDYGLEGQFTEEGMAFIDEIGFDPDAVAPVPDLVENGEEEYVLDFDEEGLVTMQLDQDTVNLLKGVYFELAYADEENDIMLLLGQDNDIIYDWENGVFKDNFRGVWGSIDGHLVYMEINYEGDDYTVYSVPILLNGEEYNLRVVYDYNDEEYYISGARKAVDDNGMADKNLVQLQPGDEITTIHYVSSFSGDDDFEATEIETFEVTEDTSFYEVDLGDGMFYMTFELVDAKNNVAYSQLVEFAVDGEDWEVSIYE